MNNKDEYILCAAIYINDGIVHHKTVINKDQGYPILGYRHNYCIMTMAELGVIVPEEQEEQGFITSKNRFVTREEARIIAEAAGQIKHTSSSSSNKLYSEDIY